MNLDVFSDVLFVLLGWFLATLNPGVVDAISRRKRSKNLLAAIATELHERRFIVALVLQRICAKLRSMDQATLDIIKPVLLAYSRDDEDPSYLEATRKLLQSGDAAYIAMHNAATPAPEKSLYPIPYDAPFLIGHVNELDLFPVEVQQRLLRVVSELRMFNDQVAIVQRAHDRSFTALSVPNHAINEANLAAGTEKLAVRAAALINAINAIVDQDGNPR